MTILTIQDGFSRRFREVWQAALLNRLREASRDAAWKAGSTAVEAEPNAAPTFAAELIFSQALRGRAAIAWATPDALAWARAAGSESGADSADLSSQDRTRLKELLEAVAAEVAVGLCGLGRGECLVQLGRRGDARPAAEIMPLHFIHPDGRALNLGLELDAELHDALRQNAAAEAEAERLDLLRGVELEVTLRFGARQVPLGEVLDFAPGAVVELDRGVGDDVELLVGNRVMAWGEVVVVDGNYGLRVRRLPSVAERTPVWGGVQ